MHTRLTEHGHVGGRIVAHDALASLGLSMAPATQTPTKRTGAPTGSETVLLAEDDPALLNLASRMLRRQGYTVLEAAGGPEALTVAETYAGTIHLLLTDVVMPKLGGKALSIQVTQLHPGIRILFMSGYISATLICTGQLTPADQMLPKPFTPDILSRAVRAILDG